MITERHIEISSRASSAVLFAVCSIIFLVFVISATIVLALIPVYLKPRDFDTSIIQNTIFFNAIYASDALDGRSLTLSNTNDLSTQMLNNIPHLMNSIIIQSAQFLPLTASARKKRQTTITCEEPTGLYGDLFSARHMLKYPPMCHTPYCEQRYLNKIQNSIRENNHRRTFSMTFTNGETRLVQLAFCSFSTADINPNCTSNTSKYIYLLDENSNFFQFNPTTFDITLIGTTNCSTTAYPYSMALQRDGKAWTLYTDGNLYTFDTQTGQCQTTSFLSQQTELTLFGMNFVADESNNTERLYITSDSANPPFRLGIIDVDSLEISIISYYESIYARAELTTTNDGRLFGLFEGTPFIIAELNPTNGDILSQTSQNMIQYTSDSSYFGFTSYLSNFFLFVGNNSSTDIFLFDLSTQITTKMKTISNAIVGVGVSTCLQYI